MEGLCRGDGEHTGAGAKIENVARLRMARKRIECNQAAPCGAMVAGAERLRCLDFDTDG